MERVTVHLQAVGIRHFTGPSCYHEAEKWAHDEIGRRVDGCAVILKRIGPVMAIYATPCDDMGAHV